MEGKKIIVLHILLLTIVVSTQAQKLPIWVERKGCVRAQGNLAGGYLFQQKQGAAYLTGDIDLFVDNRASVTGAIWGSFATTGKHQVGIRANHAVLFGMSYHFLKKGRFDPYIGFTPGIGMVQANYQNGDVITTSKFGFTPLLSASLGCNYYIGWIFNFFVKVQGVSGQLLTDVPKPVRVDELKVTAGLGWNLRLWKPKQKAVTGQRI